MNLLVFLSGFVFLSLQIWQTFQTFIEQWTTFAIYKKSFESLLLPTIIFCARNHFISCFFTLDFFIIHLLFLKIAIEAKNGGEDCKGENIVKQNCKVDCKWNEFSAWEELNYKIQICKNDLEYVLVSWFYRRIYLNRK